MSDFCPTGFFQLQDNRKGLAAVVVVKMDTPFSLFSLLALVLMLLLETAAAGSVDTGADHQVKGIIGAIVDDGSRIGKEERVAMEMAMEAFNDYNNNQSLVLLVRNSRKEPLRAAVVATDLIKTQGAKAILGPQTWEELSLVAEIGSRNHIPVLSFADMTPTWATDKWPFLLAASPNQHAEMQAIASIVQSYEWHQVTVIYEDIGSSLSGVIHLFDALREKGIEINHVGLPPVSSLSLTKELERLKGEQCRVFVVHLSSSLAVHLFKRAKRMKMMENEFVWITTSKFTNLIHSVKASTIASTMQGIVGVKSYISYNRHFQDFHFRFRKRFSLEHPEESNHEPGVYAVQAYDALWMLAQAMSEGKEGKLLLEENLHRHFRGLNGKVHFINQKVAPTNIFQIINIIGRSYRELGFWSGSMGFSEKIDDIANHSLSMKDLGQVFWPGGFSNTPRGWNLPTNSKPLRVGVPTRSIFKTYVDIQYDQVKNETSISGLAIELFNKTVKQLLFPLPYDLIPFNGTYDELVMQIDLKQNFDAVVGDVAIISSRYKYAEFTQPFTEAGLVMLVPLQLKASNRAWLFMRPFTKAMWFLIVIINIYNGFVVWLIERHHCLEFNGSALNQTASLLWLSISTLFSYNGERLHSNLSRMTMAVWLFVALVLTQIYTANLASILTTQALEPTVSGIESLQKSNAVVGHTQASFVKRYLVDVLHFNPRNMKHYTSPEALADDLRNGAVAAIFLESAVAKLFLARYCKSFTMAGPTYKVGGYGFAFPKGSPLLHSVTEALLNLSETGKLRELENSMIAAQNCTEVGISEDINSLSLDSFWALFSLTGCISTLALIVYVSHCKWESNHSIFANWILMLSVIRSWANTQTNKLFSKNVRKVPETSANTLQLWTHV
ncbi:Glutamate receptor 2.7, putative [Theobroma cacao]|uniref:Glutamate receptor n=1 Tax=Theobroma cacao TaxID=3641 RepID=A0A061F835_THECC|nr:Glutamate receptor 2.7, putative [Theobroma cacao]